jgi:hypothetical protein
MLVRSRWFRIAPVVLVVVVACAGCGGGESENDAQADTTAAETVINDEDQAKADAIVLGLDDFPTGWRADMKVALSKKVAARM